jgi:hypothetical protein
VVSEPFDWIGGRSAWELFHGIDVALLVLGLAAAALGAAPLLGVDGRLPFAAGQALTACGGIVTTIVLIFLDTSQAEIGAYLGLLAALAILAAGLCLGAPGRGETEPPPSPGWYPDPQSKARLRFWDGASWSDQTRD